MAAEVNKPDFSYQWSSGGSIVAPSNVKIQTGWTAEVPPFQWENYLQNRQDNAILHLFQKGISEWDAASDYYFTASGTRSYVQGSDGIIYVAVQDSVGQNPTTDVSDTYWKVAFADNSTALTTTTGDARYTRRSNNLSDVASTSAALSNLGGAPLASPALTGVPTGPTAAVSTNTTQLATTAFVQSQFNGSQQLLAATGYQKLPGGLIIQWGTGVTGVGGGTQVNNFATVYPNSILSLTTQCPNVTATADVIETGPLTTSGFTAVGVSSGSGGLTSVQFRYIALGY